MKKVNRLYTIVTIKSRTYRMNYVRKTLTKSLLMAIIETIYLVMRKRSNLILLKENGFMAGRS